MNREVERVTIERVDKDTVLKSRPLVLTLRLFGPYQKTGFNGWT